MNNITVIGGGVLGSQIAFQSSFMNKNVTILLRSEESIERTKVKLNKLKENYINDINLMSEGKIWCLGICSNDEFDKDKLIKRVNDALDNIKYDLDIKSSIESSELIIESMTENINLKREVLNNIKPYLSKSSIVVTNSSTILPSKLMNYVHNKERFLSLHFANSIWKNNVVEVMKTNYNSIEVTDKVMEFAREINMIPLLLNKEKSGYLLNSMLIPLLFSAMDLYVNGISDIKSIDEAWIRGTGSPKGPFMILDIVGLNTAYEIVKMYVKTPSFLAPYNFKGMEKLLRKYIDEGKLGKSVKKGFYDYDE